MNFSRRSFATSAARRPQQATLAMRHRRSAMPTTPSPFFRQPTPPQASMKIEPVTRALAA